MVRPFVIGICQFHIPGPNAHVGTQIFENCERPSFRHPPGCTSRWPVGFGYSPARVQQIGTFAFGPVVDDPVSEESNESRRRQRVVSHLHYEDPFAALAWLCRVFEVTEVKPFDRGRQHDGATRGPDGGTVTSICVDADLVHLFGVAKQLNQCVYCASTLLSSFRIDLLQLS